MSELDDWADAVVEKEWAAFLDMVEAETEPDERRVRILLGEHIQHESQIRYALVDDNFETVLQMWDADDEIPMGLPDPVVHPRRVLLRGFHTHGEAIAWVNTAPARTALNKIRTEAAALERSFARARKPRTETET